MPKASRRVSVSSVRIERGARDLVAYKGKRMNKAIAVIAGIAVGAAALFGFVVGILIF